MISYKKQKGFSLIEVMMTLLVLSLILVLMAPFMTKKFKNRNRNGVVFEYNEKFQQTQNDNHHYCFATTIDSSNNITYVPTNDCAEYEFTVPRNVHKINLTLVAGGGGGGGAAGLVYWKNTMFLSKNYIDFIVNEIHAVNNMIKYDVFTKSTNLILSKNLKNLVINYMTAEGQPSKLIHCGWPKYDKNNGTHGYYCTHDSDASQDSDLEDVTDKWLENLYRNKNSAPDSNLIDEFQKIEKDDEYIPQYCRGGNYNSHAICQKQELQDFTASILHKNPFSSFTGKGGASSPALYNYEVPQNLYREASIYNIFNKKSDVLNFYIKSSAVKAEKPTTNSSNYLINNYCGSTYSWGKAYMDPNTDFAYGYKFGEYGDCEASGRYNNDVEITDGSKSILFADILLRKPDDTSKINATYAVSRFGEKDGDVRLFTNLNSLTPDYNELTKPANKDNVNNKKEDPVFPYTKITKNVIEPKEGKGGSGDKKWYLWGWQNSGNANDYPNRARVIKPTKYILEIRQKKDIPDKNILDNVINTTYNPYKVYEKCLDIRQVLETAPAIDRVNALLECADKSNEEIEEKLLDVFTNLKNEYINANSTRKEEIIEKIREAIINIIIRYFQGFSYDFVDVMYMGGEGGSLREYGYGECGAGAQGYSIGYNKSIPANTTDYTEYRKGNVYRPSLLGGPACISATATYLAPSISAVSSNNSGLSSSDENWVDGAGAGQMEQKPGGMGGAGGTAVRIIGFEVTPGETYIIRVGKGGNGGRNGLDNITTKKDGVPYQNMAGGFTDGTNGDGGTSTSIWRRESNGAQTLMYLVTGGAGGLHGNYLGLSHTKAIIKSPHKLVSSINNLIDSTVLDNKISTRQVWDARGHVLGLGDFTLKLNGNNDTTLSSVAVAHTYLLNPPYRFLNYYNIILDNSNSQRCDDSISHAAGTDTCSSGYNDFIDQYEESNRNQGNDSDNYFINNIRPNRQNNSVPVTAYNGLYYQAYTENGSAAFVGGLGGFSGLGTKAGCGGMFMGNSSGVIKNDANELVSNDLLLNKFISPVNQILRERTNGIYDIFEYYDNCNLGTPDGQSAKYKSPNPKELTFGSAGSGGGGGGYTVDNGAGKGGNGQNGYLMIDWSR